MGNPIQKAIESFAPHEASGEIWSSSCDLYQYSGAYPGVGAEERGQGEAIARNLMEMSDLKVPIIAIIIGEGGSGGALALAVADKVWMLEKFHLCGLESRRFCLYSLERWKPCHGSSRVDEDYFSRIVKYGNCR